MPRPYLKGILQNILIFGPILGRRSVYSIASLNNMITISDDKIFRIDSSDAMFDLCNVTSGDLDALSRL